MDRNATITATTMATPSLRGSVCIVTPAASAR
jgi:hypothetical protein